MQVPDHSISEAEARDLEQSVASANDVLFLALYLILLAFFIILNANASLSERKTMAVVETFRPDFVQPPVRVDVTALVGSRLEERLIEVFDRHIPEGGWQVQTLEGHTDILLPFRKAFAEGSSILQPGRISLVRRLGEVLGKAQAEDGLRLDVTIGGRDEELARRRAAALARDLVRSGILPSRFEAGTDADAGETIRIRLLTHGQGEG